MKRSILACIFFIANVMLVAQATLPVVGDATKGRAIAEEQCAPCHGVNGVSARSGAPFIAGQEQEYLVRSLLSYGNGSRNQPVMKEVYDKLNPITLANVTAYYSQLDTEWSGAVANPRSRAIIDDHESINAAKHIVHSCLSCHSLTARYQKDEAVPNLDGMPLEYFIPSLKSYLNGKRDNQFMKHFKGRLSNSDIYNIGVYYASQRPQKAIEPKSGDATAGKIAARSCAGCHGYDGNSLNPHIPNLAGHSANYLSKVIKDYRDGKRSDFLMYDAVKRLSDKSIENLAAYYAQQQPESQLHKDLTSSNAFNPLKDGEKLSASCDSCHGENGNSSQAGIPSLTGLDVKYIVRATQGYQMGLRKHPAMREIIDFYSDTDIEKVAYFYAMQKPEQKKAAIKGDIEHGEALSIACKNCHGEKGISSEPAVTPSLAGQDAKYIVNATLAYGTGKRNNDSMKSVAEKLSRTELKALAAYFSQQTAQQVKTYLPTEPDKLVKERCERCHGENGHSPYPGIPRLAGQTESYLILALKEYRDHIRKDPAMTAMSDVLSLLEIKAMAAYYAKQ
ncbi:c-type cytochrome [Pseudomonadota bacterium]